VVFATYNCPRRVPARNSKNPNHFKIVQKYFYSIESALCCVLFGYIVYTQNTLTDINDFNIYLFIVCIQSGHYFNHLLLYKYITITAQEYYILLYFSICVTHGKYKALIVTGIEYTINSYSFRNVVLFEYINRLSWYISTRFNLIVYIFNYLGRYS